MLIMFNFYQSKVWRDISVKVYQKSIFEVDFLGKKYFGIEKIQSKLGVKFKWFQLLGLELPFDRKYNQNEITKQLNIIKRDFGKGFSDIFFQFGFINDISSYDAKSITEDGFQKEIMNIRQGEEKIVKEKFNLEVSFRENMPMATIMIDLSKSNDELLKEMNSQCQRFIRKAQKSELSFELADMASNGQDVKDFYDIWHQTSYDKGFNIIDRQTYHDLMTYLTENKCGTLFLSKKDGKIVSGSICVFSDDCIVYLYGASNREFGNIGGHHFLKYQMFLWGKENGYKYVDLLGVAPSGYDSHHLSGVSNFKQSLGGRKIEYLGNFDMVFNKNLYETFRFMRKIKGH